jgi:hypothetical protein
LLRLAWLSRLCRLASAAAWLGSTKPISDPGVQGVQLPQPTP